MFRLISVFLAALAIITFADLGISKTIQKRSAEPDSSVNITLREFCAKQVGISLSFIKEVEEEDKEPNEDYFCYMLCILTTSGIIDEDGTLNIDKFIEEIDDEVDVKCLNTMPKFTECTDLAELDKCEDSKEGKKPK